MRVISCIRDGCGDLFDKDAPETRDLTTLRAFFQRYCPKHRVAETPQQVIIGVTQEESDLLTIKEAALFAYGRMDGGDREALAEHLDLSDAEMQRIFSALEKELNKP